MFKFTIPKTPTDKYELSYWELSWDEYWYYIKEMKVTFYKNTKWDEYSPNESGGADLINDWMISEKVNDGWVGTGRFCGWDSIKDKSDSNLFATKKEAIIEAKYRYGKEIIKMKKRIEKMEQLREQLKKE